jgi:signal transduction histidine kinase
MATLVVEDDGPGIDPALERRVFERFVRGSGDGGRGSGLGLAIVDAVATSHGGTVALARPERGSGTRFVVQLPQRPLARGKDDSPQTSTTTGSTIGRRRSRS